MKKDVFTQLPWFGSAGFFVFALVAVSTGSVFWIIVAFSSLAFGIFTFVYLANKNKLSKETEMRIKAMNQYVLPSLFPGVYWPIVGVFIIGIIAAIQKNSWEFFIVISIICLISLTILRNVQRSASPNNQ